MNDAVYTAEERELELRRIRLADLGLTIRFHASLWVLIAYATTMAILRLMGI